MGRRWRGESEIERQLKIGRMLPERELRMSVDYTINVINLGDEKEI